MNNSLLEKLVNEKIQTTYAKIVTYSFDEKPLSSIEGRVSGGSIQANGASAVRRTLSLSMVAKPEIANIENFDNEIAINKKVKIYIGRLVENEIMWFNCGFYVISNASVNQSTSGWTISISGKDKMALLDGTAGGTLPTAVTFHEIFEDLSDGNYKIDYPTIYQIIQEAVNHYGEIPLHDIIINDLEKVAKVLIKYIGGKPIYFAENYASFAYAEDAVHIQKYTYGQDVGYEFTAFTYPGELVLAAGATVVNLLEKICQILGNYEYFFDLDGRFIFQEKKNYLNTVSPIAYLVPQDYIQSYSTEAAYEIKDSDTLVSLTRSPRYEDIKNDFVVWGKNTSGVDIHYRLVIDEKPVLNKCKKYMWSVVNDMGDVINYLYTDTNTKPAEAKELAASPCEEWREEIYRNALERQVQAQSTEPYDAEMLAFWRLLYNPDNKDWVYANYPEYNHWNPSVREDPASLIFWIDFIDTTSEVGKYAVSQIGRRMKVVNNDSIKILFTKQIPPIVFIPDYQEVADLLEIEYADAEDAAEKVREYCAANETNYFFQLSPQVESSFVNSSTGSSAFDEIRNLLYQYLVYNTTISISCLPRYWYEPNNMIYLENRENGIQGNYVITQYSLPLTYNVNYNDTGFNQSIRRLSYANRTNCISFARLS